MNTIGRIFVALLVGFVVFLVVLFGLNPFLPGIGVYAAPLGFVSALAWFFWGQPLLTRRG